MYVHCVCVVHLVCKCANNGHTIPLHRCGSSSLRDLCIFCKQPGAVAAFSACEGKLTMTLGVSARVKGRHEGQE